MTADSSPEMSPQPQSDDAYWAALFEQEEALLPTENKPDIPLSNKWAPLNQRIDGRFRWSDGERMEEADPWQKALELMNADDTLTLTVTGFNKGGLLVQWQGLQGFVPGFSTHRLSSVPFRKRAPECAAPMAVKNMDAQNH